MRTVFLQAVESSDKAQRVTELIHGRSVDAGRWEVDPADFADIPGAPFAYWASGSLRRLFADLPRFEARDRIARKGLTTSDDFRYVRDWWETSALGRVRWSTYAKGGGFGRFYADQACVIRWTWKDLTIPGYTGRPGRESPKVESADIMGRPGLTWPLRSSAFSPSTLPADGVFSARGYTIQASVRNLPWLLALASSTAFDSLFKLCLGRKGFPEFIVGILQMLPVPDLAPADEAALASLARRAWSLKRSLDTRTETSHAFVLPALLQVSGDTLAARAAGWGARVRETEDELATIQVEIDERCFALYGISDEDRRSITEGFGGSAAGSEEEAGEGAGAEDEDEAEADTADTAALAAELVSWAAGVAFGRFDVRLATGARELPSEPEPFDPLPVCSPGMLTGADGLPVDAPPAGYPLAFPADGVLVDDPGHRLDLTAAVRAVFETVFGAQADAAWQEAGDLLDPKGHEVAAWLRSGFFEHHLRRHSKSRRKAPIVWQLGSGRSGIFAYAHRLTRDSPFAIANEVAAPRLATEERKLASLRTQAGPSPSARDRAEIDAAEAAVDEARAVLAEVRRVAPLWEPDLDDGIVLVSAPLWRLVPHKAWQKELKGRWDDLVAGKYDWAHLAMHLWPERVVPKCATDRSLAIAHGLEDVFWVEGADGKWAKRGRPTRPVEDLIAERTSPAVKAALADLLGAPPPDRGTGSRGRGRS
jgi:hypothetical protein